MWETGGSGPGEGPESSNSLEEEVTELLGREKSLEGSRGCGAWLPQRLRQGGRLAMSSHGATPPGTGPGGTLPGCCLCLRDARRR